jgi:hypothetical protein
MPRSLDRWMIRTAPVTINSLSANLQGHFAVALSPVDGVGRE